MLAQMAREPDDFSYQPRRQRNPRVSRIDPRITHPILTGGVGGPAPDLARQTRDHVLAEPHDLAHLADRGARAEMDHSRRQPCAMAAVALINPLDHLFAALMLKIYIDIRRLAAFLADEAFKDQSDAFRGHFSHAEQIADYRICRRTAPLAQNTF